jgi:hypothetical protein
MDLAQLVERGEATAYLDIFRAVPARLAESLGIQAFGIGDGTALMASKMDVPEFNRVLGLGVTEPARAEHLDEVVARYRPLGLAKARFQLSPTAEPQADLRRWLVERDMPLAPAGWTKRVRESASAPDVATQLAVVDATQAPGAFGATACAGFGMPSFLAPWLDALVGRPDWRCFVAFDGEAAVGAGALYLGEDFGWLGIAATLPEARGRGAQGALIQARIAGAHAAAKPWVITETGAPGPREAPGPSYRNMDRYGFAEVCLRPNFVI